MPIIPDNKFLKKTIGIIAKFLNAIQGNFTSVQSELNALDNFVEWA